jgi:nucleotidyltransferase/DNA polymerase involved in DNA repair
MALVEPLSLDEAFFEVTGNYKGDTFSDSDRLRAH